jgi:hypothetical protein
VNSSSELGHCNRVQEVASSIGEGVPATGKKVSVPQKKKPVIAPKKHELAN